MKPISILLSALLFALSAQAQISLSGKVADAATSSPISYATIALMDTDSTILTGTTTDSDGNYSLSVPSGNYILSASFLGYASQTVPVHLTHALQQHFTLSEEAEMLAEVEVKAKRPLVERQMDKLVLNVSDSPFANGSNGQDLLRKAPGVNVDKDGNITVNGKSVEVWINGRPSNLSGSQLAAMLEGTDGSTIEKIEIITSPSAKYDAAGQGGVINIKTKHNMMQGLNGSVSANYGGMYFKNIPAYTQRENASLMLNYRGANTYTSFSLSQALADNYHSYTLGTQTDTTLLKNSTANYNPWQYYDLRLSNDWYINPSNTFGFIVHLPIFHFTNTEYPEKNYSTFSTRPDTTCQFSSIYEERNSTSERGLYPSPSINLNYTHTFCDSLSQELTVEGTYLFASSLHNTSRTSYTNIFGVGSDSLSSLNRVKSYTHMATVKADFTSAFWRTAMAEAGVKWDMTTTSYLQNMDTTHLGTSLGQGNNNFVYTEHIAAAYVTLAKQFGTKFSTKLGLRGEFTHSLGRWESSDSVTKSSYFNLFPTAYFGYTPTPNWNLSLSYNRSIQRPDYNMLNPLSISDGSHSIYAGNSELKPYYAHTVGFTVAYSQYVSLNFEAGAATNCFEPIVRILPDGNQFFQYTNASNKVFHNILLSLTEVPLVHIKSTNRTWLTLSTYAAAYHSIHSSPTRTQKSWSGFLQGSLTAYLPLDFRFSVDGMYCPPTEELYSTNAGWGMMNVALRKSFLNKTLTLSLQANDLLRSASFRTNFIAEDGSTSTLDVRPSIQRVSIGLSYNFGQYQQHKYRRVGDTGTSSRLSSGKAQ